MIPKLVIFDCDGVLVDSEPVTNRIIAASLSAHGLPLTEHEVGSMFIGGTIKGVATEAANMGATIPDDWVDKIYAEMFAGLAKGVPVFDGVTNLLDALEAHGVAKAIASNGPQRKMEITLTPTHLWDRFAPNIYSGHDYVPKPDPATLNHAMQVAGATPETTIFIDDSVSGCGAGIAAGVTTYGFAPDDDGAKLSAIGAKPVHSMKALQALIGL